MALEPGRIAETKRGNRAHSLKGTRRGLPKDKRRPEGRRLADLPAPWRRYSTSRMFSALETPKPLPGSTCRAVTTPSSTTMA